jgi:hypothetical protein
MSEYEQAVFISYAWGGEREDIVNQIDETLQKRGIKIIRDKRSLGYRGSIKEFMERIGQGHCVIVVISDKYLRSPNCMFEMVEIADNKQFHDRIFPIVLSDADIYDPVRRIEYVKYWETKRAELAEAMRSVDPANLQGIRDDMDQYDRIRDRVSGITSILKDMNTLTPDMHKDSQFSSLYDAIVQRMDESTAGSTAESDPMVKNADDEHLTQAKAETGDKPKKEPIKPSSDTRDSSGSNNIQGTNVSGGINIQGTNVNVGGDIVGGNKTVFGGEPKKANLIKEGFERINQQIDKLPEDPDVDKSYLKLFVKDIEREATKESGFNEKKLKNSLKMLMQNSQEVYSIVTDLLKSPEIDAPLEILNLLDLP